MATAILALRTDPDIVLTLSSDEASIVRTALRKIGGTGVVRNRINEVERALCQVGVRNSDGALSGYLQVVEHNVSDIDPDDSPF